MASRLNDNHQYVGDTLIPYLLFAYREVPQASHRLSCSMDAVFEAPLIYCVNHGRHRGRVRYVIATQEKLKTMAELVKENSEKAQKSQKAWYEELREFAAGDPVHWCCYQHQPASCCPAARTVRRVGRITYLVDKRKRKRIFLILISIQ